MKICAYCGAADPATKEHIWPKSLIDKYESLRTYNPKTNKYFVGDPVIKDVCSYCNNEDLSKLDAYLSKLYDQSFCRIVMPGEDVTFEYNYELLLRSILKISYNSSRAFGDKKVITAHEVFKKYIIKGGYSAPVLLRLQIVTGASIVGRTGGPERVLNPEAMRCATMDYDGALKHRFLIRMVAVNSYWFYLILSYKKEPEHKWKEFLNGFSSWATPAGVAVKKGDQSIYIPVSKTTYMHPSLLGKLLLADIS
jgi:hypothetical protein